MKKIILILFLRNYIMAQNTIASSEPIQADRPDQTETAWTVPKNMIQIETGFSLEKKNTNEFDYMLPSVLWKYGVSDTFEVRLITTFLGEQTKSEKNYGITPVLIGFKTFVLKEKGIIPKTSLIGHIALPNISSEKFKRTYLAPQFRLAMQHTLSKKATLSYNLGSEWNGFTPAPTFIYSIATGYSITEKIGTYAETFGSSSQNKNAIHAIDAGLTYLVTNNTMIDASSGFYLTKRPSKYYVSIGFSFRR